MPFQKGNSKLGNAIYTWSIPAGSTCPGKSKPCEECYAQDGFFKMRNVHDALYRNELRSKESDFVQYAVDELTRLKAKVCRIHVAGDMYDAVYAAKWYNIMQQLPDVRFFLYTRSWRVEEIRPELLKMSRDLPNLRQWWSVDWDTGKPKRVPKRVRLAYMQTSATDLPRFNVDLIFRVDELRGTVMKRHKKALVCPVENGVNEDFTCVRCGFCWRDKGEDFGLVKPPLKPRAKRRVALPLVA